MKVNCENRLWVPCLGPLRGEVSTGWNPGQTEATLRAGWRLRKWLVRSENGGQSAALVAGRHPLELRAASPAPMVKVWIRYTARFLQTLAGRHGDIRSVFRMTQPIVPEASDRLSTTWLPRCRTWAKPSFSMARIGCAPETRGSLGKSGLEHSDEWPAEIRWGDFFQVELGGFLKVGDRFFDSLTLAHRAHFRAFHYVEIAFLVQYGSKCQRYLGAGEEATGMTKP